MKECVILTTDVLESNDRTLSTQINEMKCLNTISRIKEHERRRRLDAEQQDAYKQTPPLTASSYAESLPEAGE